MTGDQPRDTVGKLPRRQKVSKGTATTDRWTGNEFVLRFGCAEFGVMSDGLAGVLLRGGIHALLQTCLDRIMFAIDYHCAILCRMPRVSFRSTTYSTTSTTT